MSVLKVYWTFFSNHLCDTFYLIYVIFNWGGVDTAAPPSPPPPCPSSLYTKYIWWGTVPFSFLSRGLYKEWAKIEDNFPTDAEIHVLLKWKFTHWRRNSHSAVVKISPLAQKFMLHYHENFPTGTEIHVPYSENFHTGAEIHVPL